MDHELLEDIDLYWFERNCLVFSIASHRIVTVIVPLIVSTRVSHKRLHRDGFDALWAKMEKFETIFGYIQFFILTTDFPMDIFIEYIGRPTVSHFLTHFAHSAISSSSPSHLEPKADDRNNGERQTKET